MSYFTDTLYNSWFSYRGREFVHYYFFDDNNMRVHALRDKVSGVVQYHGCSQREFLERLYMVSRNRVSCPCMNSSAKILVALLDNGDTTSSNE